MSDERETGVVPFGEHRTTASRPPPRAGHRPPRPRAAHLGEQPTAPGRVEVAHTPTAAELVRFELTMGKMASQLERACRLAKLRTIGWHVARHTFASHLVMRGVPMRAVQELMGHASIVITMRYAHLAPEVSRDAVKLLDVSSNPPRLDVVATDWQNEPSDRVAA